MRGLHLSPMRNRRGKRNGVFIEIDKTGSITKKAEYKNDVLEGQVSEWFRGGRLSKVNTYKNGKLDGRQILCYEKGGNLEVSEYKDGMRDGLTTWYYESGQKKMTIEYTKGQFNGKQESFYPDGSMKSEATYKDGALKGKKNDMLNFAATSALRAEDYATALGYFNELKNNGVDGVDVYKHLAACYNGMGDSENAMAMINAGLEKDPSDASLIVEKVNAYMKEGKTVEAVEDINKLLALDPQNAQLLFVLGTIYGDENNKDVYDTEKAKKYYEDAIEINPDYYDAIYNLGALYITMSNKLKTEANELPLNKVKEYNDLVKQAEDLVRTQRLDLCGVEPCDAFGLRDFGRTR